GNDVLNGGLGNDKLYGGAPGGAGASGDDTFTFDDDPTGAAIDTVMDFGNSAGDNDTIDLSYVVTNVNGNNFAQWKTDNVEQDGANTVIHFGDDQAVLLNVTASTLNFDDFLFSDV
ncbi:MAG: hypothetical protein LBE78_12490, partial [Burkholderiaceae bacterium]|nr:hypothetical protein [Burkholderiaceae bacterium]